MATGKLRTWLSLLAGVSVVGAIALSADEPAKPDARQTQALASLITPPAPDSFAIAGQTSCVEDMDFALQTLAIPFAQGSTTLDAESTPLLSQIATRIMDCEDAHVQVAGHADGIGDDQTNLRLSWDRADETLAALVMLGVDPAKLEAIGYGARVALAQGSDDGAAANRRVDFRVMQRRD